MNQNGVVRKTLALHLAGETAHRGGRVTLIDLGVRFVRNRCGARTVITRKTAETPTNCDLQVLASTIGQCVVSADAAQTGPFASEITESSPTARDMAVFAAEIERFRIGRIVP